MNETIQKIETLLIHYQKLKEAIRNQENFLQNEFLTQRHNEVKKIINHLESELRYYTFLEKQL